MKSVLHLSFVAACGLALSSCAAVNSGNVHAHGGPAGGDWEGHVKGKAKVVKDADLDGIPDRIDNCPNEVGSIINHGCPFASRVEIQDGKLAISDKVYFQTGADVIEERSFALLDEIAGVLKNHPEITAVAIEGHTDNTGDAAFNVDLSKRRAEAVKAGLESRGIAAERLSAEGFGSDKPIADNGTEDGRAANRRVEFRTTATVEG